MAMIYAGMPCSICASPIDPGESYVATTHFIPGDKDPLYRYSDASWFMLDHREVAAFQWKHSIALLDEHGIAGLSLSVWAAFTEQSVADIPPFSSRKMPARG